MEESAFSVLHSTPLKNSLGGIQCVCTIPTRVAGDTDYATSCSSSVGSQVALKSNTAPFTVGFLPQTWGGCETNSLDCGGLPWAGRSVGVVEISGGQFRPGEVYPIKPLAAFALVDDMGFLYWKVVAINAGDVLAGDLNSTEDLQRQMPGLLDIVKQWLPDCASDSSAEKFAAFGFYGRPQDADLAMRVILHSHASWTARNGKQEVQQSKVSVSRSLECVKLPRQNLPDAPAGLLADMPRAHSAEEVPSTSPAPAPAPPARQIRSQDLDSRSKGRGREHDLSKIAVQVRLVAERVANPTTLPSHHSNPALLWDLALAEGDGVRAARGGGAEVGGGGLRAAKAAEQQRALDLLADGMKRLRQLSEAEKGAKKPNHQLRPPRLQLPLDDDVDLHFPLPTSAIHSPDTLPAPSSEATHPSVWNNHTLTSPRPHFRPIYSLAPRFSPARSVQGQVSFHLARIGLKERLPVTEAMEADVSEIDIPVASVLSPFLSPSPSSFYGGALSHSFTPSLGHSLASNYSTPNQSSPTSSPSPHRKVSFNEFVEVLTFEKVPKNKSSPRQSLLPPNHHTTSYKVREQSECSPDLYPTRLPPQGEGMPGSDPRPSPSHVGQAKGMARNISRSTSFKGEPSLEQGSLKRDNLSESRVLVGMSSHVFQRSRSQESPRSRKSQRRTSADFISDGGRRPLKAPLLDKPNPLTSSSKVTLTSDHSKRPLLRARSLEVQKTRTARIMLTPTPPPNVYRTNSQPLDHLLQEPRRHG